MKYGIAYLDQDGEGSVDDLPYLDCEHIESLDDTLDKSLTMLFDGCQKVAAFGWEGVLPFRVTWEFVDEHRVDI